MARSLKKGPYVELALQAKIEKINHWESIISDTEVALEIGDEDLIKETENSLIELEKELDKFDFEKMLSGEYDSADAILSINAGAGGTDAQHDLTPP